MVLSKDNTAHYQWGNGCDAWTLLQSPHAIIKEEIMPPGSEEHLHFHEHSDQFFYVLEGDATFLLEGREWSLQVNSCIAVRKEAAHKIINRSSGSLRFLVITFPGNAGDRINIS